VLADFLIHNISELLTCAGPAPKRGARQGDVAAIADGAVASRDGTIVFAGSDADWKRDGSLTPDAVVVDAARDAVVPGFVDPHTHVIFAGDRRDELRRRLAGATYAQIAAAGGGIVSSVRATRDATAEELAAATRARLDDMLRCGTTTCEAKSGYGLTTESELKMLRVARDLAATHAIEIAPTFMGAHDVPIEYRGRRRDYTDLIIDEMIPAVQRDGLAEWCDVFCETGVFTPDSGTAWPNGATCSAKPASSRPANRALSCWPPAPPG
jgi:imidazolonepropionase